MFKKSLTLILVLIMVSPIFSISNVTSVVSLQNTPQDSVIIADTDLGRVTVQSNTFPNNGLEDWSNAHQPEEFGTTRTTFKDAWYEHSIVYEGSTSFGMHAFAMDTYHPSEVYLTNQSQVYWYGASNLTLSARWYLNSIGNPTNQDVFRLEINIDHRHLIYYLGCENTLAVNTSTDAYFNVGGDLQTWNHLQRNVSSDYFDVFGVESDYFRTMYWRIISYTTEFTEAYIDDIYLVNGTLVKIGGSVSGGNFEGGGAWTYTTGQGAGDIAQSSTSHSGSSSMNLTAFTYDDTAYAYAYDQPEKLLTADNQANLSFWWNLENYSNPSNSMWARVTVSVENTSFSSNMYYYMFVGGSGMLPLIIMGNDMKFAVSNFNVTDSWNYFDRNIWEDFNSVYSTENLWISQISFQVRNWEDDASVSLLVDDITFAPSILNDMDYEHQNNVGDRIQGWESPPGPSEFTVTNFTESGDKAGNLTLVEYYTYLYQDMHSLPIDSTTELILDFNVYIETFNTTSEDYILFNIYFEDTNFAYVIANSTSAFEDEIENEDAAMFIILQNTVVSGEWLNFQLDIVHDYELLFGSLPDTTISDLDLIAEAGIGSKLEVYFDDLYIYYDVAPEITGIDQSPSVVNEAGDLVWINATVIDASELTVTLSYRVDDGEWINVTMDESEYDFRIDINASYGVTEYFITAEDAFGKTDVAMDGGEYFTFTAADTISPIISLTPANGATVSDIVSIQIEVTDIGSGFASAVLYIEGSEITTVTLASVGISWDTTVIANGEYNITVVAADNAGNTASVTHFVTVQNIGGGAPDLPGVLIVAVVIAAIGIVFIIYIFVIKKK